MDLKRHTVGVEKEKQLQSDKKQMKDLTSNENLPTADHSADREVNKTEYSDTNKNDDEEGMREALNNQTSVLEDNKSEATDKGNRNDAVSSHHSTIDNKIKLNGPKKELDLSCIVLEDADLIEKEQQLNISREMLGNSGSSFNMLPY